MSTVEPTPGTDAAETKPAKKAAPPRKRTASKPKPPKAASTGQVTIVLVGNSYNGTDGEERQVDASRAEQLVARGLARYPQPDKG